MPAKTNALRIVESLGIPHQIAVHPVSEEHLDAVSAARSMGVDPDILFKTLVARDDQNRVLVFCIPGPAELDLKKAARASGSKKVDLLPLKELTPLTGYVRGGCSPIGMKKKYPTWIDEMAVAYERIYVNAGARGLQMLISPLELRMACDAQIADLV